VRCVLSECHYAGLVGSADVLHLYDMDPLSNAFHSVLWPTQSLWPLDAVISFC